MEEMNETVPMVLVSCGIARIFKGEFDLHCKTIVMMTITVYVHQSICSPYE